MEKIQIKQTTYFKKPKHWFFSLFLTAVLIFTCSVQSYASVEQPSQPAPFEMVPLPEDAENWNVILPKSSKIEGVKLDSALQTLISGGQGSDVQSLKIADDRVQVQITVDPTAESKIVDMIKKLGGVVTSLSNDQTKLQAWLPVSMVEKLASENSVYQIRRPIEPVLFEEINVGSTTTEGLSVINGNAWHTAGHTGEGVKIAIIDGGFLNYPSLLGTDLPASVTIKNFVDFESDSLVNGTTVHGTACAEIIHDLAPDAQLFLIKIGTDLDLVEAVNWLINNHDIDIISTSLGWYNITPGDGSGEFADLVETARNVGILWITAAGNDRDAHWGGPFYDADNDGIHDYTTDQNINYFGPGDGSVYLIPSGFVFSVFLRWDDWENVNQDYDLNLLRWGTSGWEIVASSWNFQDGTPGQTPTEEAYVITTGDPTYYGFVIEKFDSNRNVNLEVFAPKLASLDETLFSRSLANLADAPEAITVAALDVTSPYPQESYSSEGPTNGPGGIANGGIIKPDISGFANVSTVSYGTTPGLMFNGTSSATPHVAGAAALILSAFPSYTPGQIQSYLEGHAVDMGTAGMDSVFGYGRLYLGTVPYSGIKVFNVVPNMVLNTGVVSVTINGANFAPGATVKLTRSGYTQVNATSIIITNGNKITCTLDLTGKALGAWNLVVTNPDTTSSTLTNGFIIVNQINKLYVPLILKN